MQERKRKAEGQMHEAAEAARQLLAAAKANRDAVAAERARYRNPCAAWCLESCEPAAVCFTKN
ncbi:MAG: hypothetical protein ACPIOQ_08615 [Promethearchaeia archaeon]